MSVDNYPRPFLPFAHAPKYTKIDVIDSLKQLHVGLEFFENDWCRAKCDQFGPYTTFRLSAEPIYFRIHEDKLFRA